jgi:hypothetical protein
VNAHADVINPVESGPQDSGARHGKEETVEYGGVGKPKYLGEALTRENRQAKARSNF